MAQRTDRSPYRAADDAHLEEERAVDRAIVAAVENAKELRLRRRRLQAALAAPRPVVLVPAVAVVCLALLVWLWPSGIGVTLLMFVVIALFAAIVVLAGRIPPGNGNTSPPMHP